LQALHGVKINAQIKVQGLWVFHKTYYGIKIPTHKMGAILHVILHPSHTLRFLKEAFTNVGLSIK
jgi:hypothetical protein